ncbi:SDR family NAD(P)-dependent oxidoreductase [Chitinasiproducens palmae]|uniref:NAD(P)-dependent dehydrogenase, short-chain alcohol dehydrogenase family n=1 Tax=Chitinasiproducens palmae TaxID=1770053 RepID=A0A1H2PU87_9BURK|nr:SDR family oxidoreductase [Chitinasiproducens palmae]SDV50736.1 NAD(P)-dependent dehydrogenase, short-chain alcohol dehydrogenase family [Chitinasiproducens palmae]
MDTSGPIAAQTSARSPARHVAITGGANGIGEACARLARASGWRVVILDRDEDAGAAVAADLGGTFHRLDLLACDALEPLRDEIEASAGPIDALINSAGISQPTAPPSALPLDVWDQVQRTHLRGSYLTCRAFGSAMAQRGGGAIVNIASIAGMRSVPLHSYGPAKAAIIAMTAGLAAEWGRSGVRVNCVSPGFTRTARVERRLVAGERDPEAYRDSALGRMVEPDEVAQACLFLLSSQASGITGVNLPVDCGWLVSGPWQAFGGLRQAYAPGAERDR